MALTEVLTKKLGPCGGDRGWDKDMNINGITRIVKISIRHSADIDALTVHFLRNDRKESTDQWGGPGGHLSEFNLEASEYITSIKGHFGANEFDWVVLRSLKFETNLRSFGPYGTQEGVTFELPEKYGGQIIGFHGRTGGRIDALGVYVQDREGILRKELEDCKQLKDTHLKYSEELRVELDSKDHLQKKLESRIKYLEKENEEQQTKAEVEYLKRTQEFEAELDLKVVLQKKLEFKIEYLENENMVLQTKFKERIGRAFDWLVRIQSHVRFQR